MDDVSQKVEWLKKRMNRHQFRRFLRDLEVESEQEIEVIIDRPGVREMLEKEVAKRRTASDVHFTIEDRFDRPVTSKYYSREGVKIRAGKTFLDYSSLDD